MSNLANSYSALGRHEEALEMREKSLEFRRRVLPENHPDIGHRHTSPLIPFYLNFIFVYAGLSLYAISHSFFETGNLQRAMEFVLESLRSLQTALPPGHQDIRNAEDMLRYLEHAMQAGDEDEDEAQEDAREVEEDI